MKSFYLLLCVFCVISFCAADTQFEEKDLIWKKKPDVKYLVWPQNIQNDGPPVQPVQPNVGPVVPPMRPTYCDPEISSIGKRSIVPSDSFPNLNSFYMNEETSDVKLVVNGTKLPAHRFLLMAKSPKFAEMFKSDPTKQEFDLGLESEDVFKDVLKYFYTERYTLDDKTDYKKAIDVYKIAQEFGMDGLKLQVERTLASMIFLSNYLDIYKFAEENQMHELVRLWMTFVFANSQQIIADESFINETEGIAEKVLSALNAPPSYVLMQIRKLMDANPELEAQHFRQVIHIERCSIEDLITLAEMKVYDEKYLFEDMIKRYRSLAASCNSRTMVRHVPRWTAN